MKIKYRIIEVAVAIILFTAITSCESTGNRASQPGNAAVDSSQIFLSHFDTLKDKVIHVYSPPYSQPDDKKFQGKLLSKSLYHFFSYDSEYDTIMQEISADTTSHIHACYKFPLSNYETGLLVRWPSQYDETAIELFVWDNKSKRIIDSKELADAFGDEGWHFVQDAWLVDLNGDGKKDIVIRKKDIDVGTYDTDKVTHHDTIYSYLKVGAHFKDSKIKLDTSRFQLKYWD